MKRRLPIPLLVAGSIVAIGLLHLVGVLHPVEDAVRWTLLPVARAFGLAGFETASQTASTPDAQTLQARVRDLEARLSSVSVDYVKLKALEEENISLKQVASFLTTSGYDHVGARIIARSTDPQTASVVIDRGARDGLQIGMAVIAGDGIFVGKISTLEEDVSTVLLVSDHGSRIAAARAGTHTLFGLVEGEGNGVAKLTLVPQAQALAQNDIIVTAGTEEKIPGDLAIGLVNDTQGQPTDPFKTATIEPLARPDALGLVVVLRPTVLGPKGGK